MDEAASPTGMSRGAMIVPIAHIGALSQAWFDALGLARPREEAARPAGPALMQKGKAPGVAFPAAALDTPHAALKVPAMPERMIRARTAVRNDVTLERAVRKQLVKRGEGLAQAQGGANDVLRRSAGRIVIHTTRGAVKMLVQRDNNRLVITAVCDPKVAGNIAAALESARQQLRARGIVADVQTYGEAA